MPCLLTIFALIAPRVIIILLWLFTYWFHGIFDFILWPILGLIFLPTTLLWYTAVHHWFGGEWTFLPIAGIAVALMIDVSPAKGRKRRRSPSSKRLDR